jgi:hypothetical protein
VSTTLTPETDQALTVPVKLWALYRQRRLTFGDNPLVACREALDTHKGYTSQKAREGLSDLLVEREEQRGLASTDAEYEEELVAEAEAAEAAAVAQEVRRQLPQLQDDWSRLQPLVAIGDPDAIEESKELESEMRSAKRELDRQAAEVAEAAKAEREGQESAAATAQKMLPQVDKLRATVDAQAAAFVASVVNLRDGTEERRAFVAVAEPGDQMAIRAAEFRPGEVESALRFHSRGVLFSRVSGQDAPLVPEVK